MKKIILALGILVYMLFGIFGCSEPSEFSEVNWDMTKQDIGFDVDNEVLIVFNLTNRLRMGREAFYWNEDDKTKTYLIGNLRPLTLDKKLCEAAQIRANEIVERFEHIRPNGTSCFTVFNELSIPASHKGENIAAGNSGGEKTFLQWKEDDCNHSGQGHRRNMLGDFTRIGIAHTYSQDSKYKHYWAMVLAK